jgi:hypothetical protein
MPGSKRNPASQSKHDRAIRAEAKNYEKRGYDVQADVPGYPQPPTVGDYRPDLMVKKGGQRTIVEVETEDSLNTAHAAAQNGAFLRARRRPSTHYRRVIAQ